MALFCVSLMRELDEKDPAKTVCVLRLLGKKNQREMEAAEQILRRKVE